MSTGLAPVLTGHRPMEGSLEAYKREQSRIARTRLYPLTAFYTAYSLIVTLLILRSRYSRIGMAFYFLGIPVWTLVEYLFHRYVLHGRFSPGQGWIRRFLHERLDSLHREHHERPLDGWHISGELKAILPLFFVVASFSFLFPVYTFPALLAGLVQSYVGEEWTHYFLHFAKFRNRYFRSRKRYHLYHHSPRGMKTGYGITSGIWDLVFHTQYPETVRKLLFEDSRAGVRVRKLTRSEVSRLFHERFKK